MSDTLTKPFAGTSRRAPDSSNELKLDNARFWILTGLVLMVVDALAYLVFFSLATKDTGLLWTLGSVFAVAWTLILVGTLRRRAWSAYWFCLVYWANCIVTALVVAFLVAIAIAPETVNNSNSVVVQFLLSDANNTYYLLMLGIKIGVLTVGFTACLKIRTVKLIRAWQSKR